MRASASGSSPSASESKPKRMRFHSPPSANSFPMSLTSKSSASATPHSLAYLRASAMNSGTRSTPRPCQPKLFARWIRSAPLPHPRSTMRHGASWTFLSRSRRAASGENPSDQRSCNRCGMNGSKASSASSDAARCFVWRFGTSPFVSGAAQRFHVHLRTR